MVFFHFLKKNISFLRDFSESQFTELLNNSKISPFEKDQVIIEFGEEGIRFAIASGRIAAETAINAHRENDFSKNILKSYQRKFYTEFKNDLLWSTKMTGLFFRFPNLVLGTLLINSEVILRYFKVMSGEISFKDFSKWTITRLPGLIFKRFILGKSR